MMTSRKLICQQIYKIKSCAFRYKYSAGVKQSRFKIARNQDGYETVMNFQLILALFV